MFFRVGMRYDTFQRAQTKIERINGYEYLHIFYTRFTVVVVGLLVTIGLPRMLQTNSGQY